jgi:hypothetical protein
MSYLTGEGSRTPSHLPPESPKSGRKRTPSPLTYYVLFKRGREEDTLSSYLPPESPKSGRKRHHPFSPEAMGVPFNRGRGEDIL